MRMSNGAYWDIFVFVDLPSFLDTHKVSYIYE